MILYPAVQGFVLGASMIIPIGAQNAFVLNQGIKCNHHLAAATICMVCDVLLIMMGVYGGSQIFANNELLLTLITWAGIVFLMVYGALSFKSVIRSEQVISQHYSTQKSLRMVIMTALGVTLLNPHVYLDTVVILGSVGNQYNGDEQFVFVIGCMLASLVWFYGLSIGAAKLSPILSRQKTKQVIDGSVGVIMWGIAASLFINRL